MVNVTVIIPAFNRSSLLERAIDSAFSQSVPVEVIVVDDASAPPLEQLLSTANRSRIRILRNDIRKNAAYSRNWGVEHATSDIVAFLDSDDEWLPNHLSTAMTGPDYSKPFIHLTPLRTVITRNAYIDDAYGFVFGGGGDFRTSGLVCGKQTFNLIGGFDANLNKHQDWDFVLRAANHCSLKLGSSVTVNIDATAPGRMSARPNLEASQRFFGRHQAMMTASHRRAFFSGIIRTCAYACNRHSLTQCKCWAEGYLEPSELDPVTRLCWYAPFPGMLLLRLRQALRRLQYKFV